MSLSGIRDLLIVIGIYLYFIAWIYLHTYYASFGISAESLRLDYSSYLIFSYNVLTSDTFIHFFIWALITCLVLSVGFIYFFQKASLTVRKKILVLKTIAVLVAMIAIFPILFHITNKTALQNYANDRTNTGERHRIEFIFRKEAGIDSISSNANYSLNRLNKDGGKNLRLLGESDEYFIVLDQPPLNTQVGSFPEGAIYYIDKKDVLVSHIILSSR